MVFGFLVEFVKSQYSHIKSNRSELLFPNKIFYTLFKAKPEYGQKFETIKLIHLIHRESDGFKHKIKNFLLSYTNFQKIYCNFH